MNRRQFLKSIGVTLGTTAAGITSAIYGFKNYGSIIPTIYTIPDEESGRGWLHLGPDGRCTFLSPRAEMGQHASLALAQLVAEELRLDFKFIDIHLPSTLDIKPQMMSSGSLSMLMYAKPVARAAAALTESLRERALQVLGPDSGQLDHIAGGFRSAGGKVLSYGDLASLEEFDINPSDYLNATLYSFESNREMRYVGKDADNPFYSSMVSGKYKYVADVSLPDMLHGYVVRPPKETAILASFKEEAAKAVKGFRQLVVDTEINFIGVIAESTYAAWKAAQALQVAWSHEDLPDNEVLESLIDVDDALSRGFKRAIQDDELDQNQDWDIDLRFDVQVQSHAQMEPRAAIAFVKEDGAELWVANQDAFVIQRQAARELGLADSEVKVNTFMLGGAFGGREHYDVEADAVRLSRVAGVPVKVQWSREDEFLVARNRPPSSHRVRASVTAEGSLKDFWHCFVSGKHFFTRVRFPDWGLKLLDFRGDFGAMNSADMPYQAQNKRIELSDIDLPISTGTWRSLGAAPNIFASDCALDELAYVVNRDPLAFKLKNLGSEYPRLGYCLEKVKRWSDTNPLTDISDVTAKSVWRGRGCAAGIYADKSFIAVSVDVQVDQQSGDIKVSRVFCCQDVGFAINPGGLRAQLESNVIWGVGMALIEKVNFDKQGVSNLNYHTYPVPRMIDSPLIEIEIVSDKKNPPVGAGETGILVMPAAIANAVRNATGKRLTRLPLSLKN